MGCHCVLHGGPTYLAATIGDGKEEENDDYDS